MQYQRQSRKKLLPLVDSRKGSKLLKVKHKVFENTNKLEEVSEAGRMSRSADHKRKKQKCDIQVAKANDSCAQEIDELFAEKKRTSITGPVAVALDQAKVKSKADAKQIKIRGNKNDLFGNIESVPRKRTTDGYKIYSEEELRINKGGDTDQCPFDCDCCF